MPIVAAKCPNCGGELQLDDNLKSGFCMYCGSRVIVQEAIELKKVQVEGKVSVEGLATMENLLTRGQQCLEAGDYKEAQGFFEKVVNIDAKNHAAWWGKFISEYENCLRDTPRVFSINNEIFANFTQNEERLKNACQKAKINYYFLTELYNTVYYENLRKNVIFPEVTDTCFFSAKKAIEYADESHKADYIREYEKRCKSYNEMAAQSEKKIIEQMLGEIDSRRSKGISRGFFIIFMPALLAVISFLIKLTGVGIVLSIIVFVVLGITFIYYNRRRYFKSYGMPLNHFTNQY